MKDYIFKYLDKRHTIEGNVVYFKDDYPVDRIRHLFDVYSNAIIHEWVQSHTGKVYIFNFPDGSKTWWKDGKFHREDGPAIIHPDGSEWWYQNDKKHRLDGPAYIDSAGYQYWYLNDELHREDGPAVIYPNGGEEWWQNGRELNQGLN